MMISAFVIGGKFLYKKINFKSIKISIMGVLLVFILFNVRAYINVALKSTHPIVTQEYIDLENISNIIPGDKLVLVNSRNPTEEVWISYFLRDSKVKLKGVLEPWGFWIFSHYSGKPNFNFFYDYKKDNIDYTLSHELKNKSDIVDADYGEIVYENEDYFLSKNIPDPFLLRGWYDAEKDNNGLYRWTQKECSVIFDKPVKDSALYIKGTVPEVYNEPVEISIILNGKVIEKFRSGPSEISKRYLLNLDSLKEFKNELSIVLNKSFIPNQVWNVADLRELGVMMRKIEIIPL